MSAIQNYCDCQRQYTDKRRRVREPIKIQNIHENRQTTTKNVPPIYKVVTQRIISTMNDFKVNNAGFLI